MRTCGASGTARCPFEWYRTCQHRFNSEFGFQSFPEPRTVQTYTRPGDRNITSAVMEHHQRSAIGNTTIMSYMCDWFRLPVLLRTDALAEPDPAGNGDQVRRGALATGHAARHGHPLLAVERLLAGGELVIRGQPRPLEGAALYGARAFTRRCWSPAWKTRTRAPWRSTSPATIASKSLAW